MVVLGLTGGIASGKSAVARAFVGRGALLVDADRIAREVVEPGSVGLQQVLQRFGADLRLSDGQLDRARLGSLVFADDAARRDLEALLHPLIRARIADATQAAQLRGEALCVIDAALLFEMGLEAACAAVVLVDCAVEQQVERLAARNGLSEQAARQRIAAQWSRQARQAKADLTLDNSGSLAELDREFDRVWHALASRFPSLAALSAHDERGQT